MENNVSINFHGYTSTKRQVKNIEEKLEFLLKQIPCDSRVSLDFNYKEKVFNGKLRVVLLGKSFFSSDQSILLDPLTSSLCKKVQKQIRKWKKSRTLEEITGNIILNHEHPESLIASSYKDTG